MPDKDKAAVTTAEIRPGDTSGIQAEFGRTADVARIFSIRRGSLYGLLRAHKVKSVLLRVAGSKSGLRLWHLDSIRDLIKSQMALQEGQRCE